MREDLGDHKGIFDVHIQPRQLLGQHLPFGRHNVLMQFTLEALHITARRPRTTHDPPHRAAERHLPKPRPHFARAHLRSLVALPLLLVQGIGRFRTSLREWIADQSERLRRSAAGAIRAELARQLLALPKTGPGNKGKRERLAAALRYLEMHRHRLPYAQLRKRDIDIGTAVVEGAVRNLVGLRLDGPGMRWSRDRAECVLHLRCILINGQWPAFENYIASLGEHFTPGA